MDQLIDQIVKAPLGAKIGGVAGIIVLLTALNYFWLPIGVSISEMEDRIVRLQKEEKPLNAEYAQKTLIANDLMRFKEENRKLEQKLLEAAADLPEQKNLDELLKDFQSRAALAELEISTIEPGAEAREGFYAKIPINMSVTGSYHHIAKFFDAVGKLRRIVNVSSISLDSPKPDSRGTVSLTAKFVATTFMFVKAPPPTAPAGVGPAGSPK